MRKNNTLRRSVSALTALFMVAGLMALPVLAAPPGEEEAASGAVITQPAAAPEADKAPAEPEKPTETKAPVATEKPVETKAPVATEKPAETKTPVETEKPVETKAPVATEKPAETKTPVETEKPAETKTPVETEKPAESKAPVATGKPAESKAPVATPKPAESKAPVATAKPAESKAPVATPKPAESKAPVATEKPAESKAPVATAKPTETVKPTPAPVVAPAATPAPTAVPTAAPAAPGLEAPGLEAPGLEAPGLEAPAADTGFTVDWDQFKLMEGKDGVSWRVAQDEDGYYFYLECARYISSTINISYDGFQADARYSAVNYFGWAPTQVMDGYIGAIDGATATPYTVDGVNYVEYFVPASYFQAPEFTLKCGESSISSADILDTDGNRVEPKPVETPLPSESLLPSVLPSAEPTPPPAYEGITIDGSFDDWAAVPRVDGNAPGLDHTSVVWDGDYIYILFVTDGTPSDYDPNVSVGNWNEVCYSGPKSSGQFVITTDIGYTLLVHPSNVGGEPSVSGVDGATVAINNKEWFGAPHMWEIAIPASALPKYRESISFGFYEPSATDPIPPMLSDILNLQGTDTTGKDFNGIEYYDDDHTYTDWDWYPHTVIQYATSGTQAEGMTDSEGALYGEGDKLYGHVHTIMPEHTGTEDSVAFTKAVTISINGQKDTARGFSPRFVTVDKDGNINWEPDLDHLDDGEYDYYMFSTSTWATSTNINELNECDVCYGKMHVTIDGRGNECEFVVDVPALADYFDMDPSEIKTFEAQFGRLGQEWLQTAGTPTGPLLGIGLCLATVGGVYAVGHKKKKDSDNDEAGE